MSSSTHKKVVGVLPASQAGQYRRLFDTLAQLYPVEFRDVGHPTPPDLDALIVLNGNVDAALAAATQGTPSFAVAESPAKPTGNPGAEVRFANSPLLEPCLRNQRMSDREAVACQPLPVEAGDEILASSDGRALWLNRTTGRAACQWVVLAPPPLCENEFLFQHLNGTRWLRLLPLMNFLRQQVKDFDWQSPPPSACFVFDDPSLYWLSYGFLDYRQLAEHSRQHRYTASIATIPIDSWWVNNSVAEIFRSSTPRLSLVIHGNNHTSRELLHEDAGTAGFAAAAQALRRMERLERRHKIPVFKVMVAPHGAIDQDLFPHLLELGYEAALVTTHLLVEHNAAMDWPPSFGMNKSEVVSGGLPVIPRIKMTAHWKNDVLIAAFLRQPIVIAGHHQDAAGGLKLLADIAATVNALDGCTWSDMKGIVRSNYLQRTTGDRLDLRMYARHITVPLPDGIRHVRVERPWIESGQTEDITVTAGADTLFTGSAGPLTTPIEAGNARIIEIASEQPHPVDSSTVAPPRPNPWPIARKILMELRDRLAPMLPFTTRYSAWNRDPSPSGTIEERKST